MYFLSVVQQCNWVTTFRSLKLACVHVHVCLHALVCVCTCMCVCRCPCMSFLGTVSRELSTVLRQSLSLGLGDCPLGYAGLWTPVLWSHVSAPGLQTWATTPGFYIWVLEIETRFLMVTQQGFYQLSCLVGPCHLLAHSFSCYPQQAKGNLIIGNTSSLSFSFLSSSSSWGLRLI